MIIKRYLPFRHSREGYGPDRLFLRFCSTNGEETERELNKTGKSAHYHLAQDGTVTALSPLSGAANALGPLFPKTGKVSDARRGILILVEGPEWSESQTEPAIRLLKHIQKEIHRIYGMPFPLRRDCFFADQGIPAEELLDRGYLVPESRTLYRVQTGVYQCRKEAEDGVERLQRAGIAAYVTEVRQERRETV